MISNLFIRRLLNSNRFIIHHLSKHKYIQATSLAISHTIPYAEAEQTMSDIEVLAKKVYKSSHVAPSDKLLRWYRRNPSLWWLAKDKTCLIGYLCAIPLSHEAFLKTKQSEFNDLTDIADNAIRPWNDGLGSKYCMHIFSFVVDPIYQRRSGSPVHRLILKHFLESLLLYGKSGCIVTEWSALAVSEIGCHVSRSDFDLTLLTHNSNNNNHIFYGKTSSEHQEQLLQRVIQKLQS
ncbi:unnamed protein product [Rotaria socialis]|uniref:Uncharacterized protein n=2 Tax=Rotaria socialis TaxID=392032 RepID=A0A817RGY0_9BILA|nr:unnamed protein product [Rotaria socialis]CAF3416463.1 unnamed protein product [Rotaria socialis]CAF3457963.1 unnamed protein product [Rotaria socialis]CAF4305146.1 unnamed protein product [Rotaria socialis]CAF4466996.1 unnamed protein product [Rotaria socialis]